MFKTKIISLILIIVILICGLCGCGRSYDEAKNEDDVYFGNGYFTVIKEWGSNADTIYRLLYANDTKVVYFYMNAGHGKTLTPMYNSDGSLQIYNVTTGEVEVK